VAAELRRGGFTDAERVERWDVAFAGLYLDAVSGPGTLLDRLLQPLNRLATQRFLREAREKVWANALVLSQARRQGDGAYATALRQLEDLSAAKVAALQAPARSC
jgi:hypothetical protein